MIIDTTLTKIERQMTPLSQEKKEAIIRELLSTDEGRKQLADAMVEPRRCGGLEYDIVDGVPDKPRYSFPVSGTSYFAKAQAQHCFEIEEKTLAAGENDDNGYYTEERIPALSC